MKRRISLPRIEGTPARQAHTDLPAGAYEREFGSEGFYGPATHILHRHPPTAWESWEGPLRPRAFHLGKLQGSQSCPWDAPVVLHNASVRIRLWRVSANMDHLVRNADGDELLFVHAGQGDLLCDFGHLAFREGDYIVLPRGTQWRLETRGPCAVLLIEATGGSYGLPDKGVVGEHAFFDPAILDVPALNDRFRQQQTEEPWQVVIKRGETRSTVRYPFNPLDAVGWQGNLLPVRINWRELRPLMSHRYHLPPSAHTTFVADRFVVCTFCPRPLESDPGALKVPFFHSNNDYDEVLFYHAGDFFSRDNIEAGMLTLHPAGFPHGPHPKAFERGTEGSKTETDEVAVMVDARDALSVGDAASAVEYSDYVGSWKA